MHKPGSIDSPLNKITKMDILQPKYDGWYTEGVCRKGVMTIYSATDAQITTLPIQPVDYMKGGAPYIIRGEYMFGTNRARQNTSTYLTLNVYDVIIGANYHDRYDFLLKWIRDYQEWCAVTTRAPQIFLTPCFTAEAFSYFFEEIKLGRLEGIVGRMFEDDVNDAIHRYKPNFCIDLIVVDINEGQGRLEGTCGALVGGQVKDGIIQPVCTVSGMTDSLRKEIWLHKQKYLGRVFEAEGSQVFEETGALRHPRFKRWRLDVLAKDVIWKGDVRYAT